MKRTLLIGLATVVILGLAGGVWTLNRQKQNVQQQYLATKASEDSLRIRFDTALVSIAEIQDSLSAILPSESAVLDVSRGVESGGRMTATRKDQVLRTISDLNASIQKSKEMIQRLETRLNERDERVASLERIVSNLKRTVADREQAIAALNQRVESLNVQVASLQTDVADGQRQISDQAQVIETKRRELSTVYYLVSTRKELKQLGVIRETGGVAGIGKSPHLSGQFPQQAFRVVDTDLQTTIPIAGKKPVILSGQSRDSYELVPTSVDQAQLRIVNPEEFRKVRYLVIQVG